MTPLRLKSLSHIILIPIVLLLAGTACSKSTTEDAKPAQSALQAGIESLRVFDFNRSFEAFQALHASTSQEDEDWPLITYSYGISAWLKTPASPENITLAIDLLNSLTEAYPESIYTATALLDLGRIAEISDFRGDPTDVTKARTYYQRVQSEFPNSEMSTRATLFLAQTYAQTLEPDGIHQAIDFLEACISQQPDEKWIGVLALYVGQLYDSYLNEPGNAVDPMLQAFKAGLPRPSSADSLLWSIGVLAEKAGRDAVALEVYTRITQDYPRTVFRSLSEQRIQEIQMK